MKRLSGAIVLLVALGAMAGPTQAAKVKLPKLTGGGQAENNNTGSTDFPEQVVQFGFSAQATAPGFAPLYRPSITVYFAKGQFQGRSFDANDPSNTLFQSHGEVVCVANLGPPSDDDGGDPSGTVWEIRVGSEQEVPFLGLTTVYGSVLVQDNGKVDYIDEDLSQDQALNPNCGFADRFSLEPVTQGNIQAR